MAVFYDHFDGSLMIRLPSGGTGGGLTSEFRGLATEAQKNQYSGEYGVYLSFKRQVKPGILLTEETIADLETRRGVVAGEIRAAVRESSTAVAHPDAGDPIRAQRDRDAAQRQADLNAANAANPDRRTQAERDAAPLSEPVPTTLPLTPAPSMPGTGQPNSTSPPGSSTPFHPPSSPGVPGIMTPRGDGHTG